MSDEKDSNKEERQEQGNPEEETEKDSGQQESHEGMEIPDVLPMLPIRDLVVFPYMIAPLVVGRERSIRALDEALKQNRLIFLTAQHQGEVEDPGKDDVHSLGTVSVIVRMLKTPDGKAKILVQGLQRARIREFLETDPFFSVGIELVHEEVPEGLPRSEIVVRRACDAEVVDGREPAEGARRRVVVELEPDGRAADAAVGQGEGALLPVALPHLARHRRRDVA